MRSFADVIRARLLATPAVTAIAGQRIYFAVPPQTPTYPLIVIMPVSGMAGRNLDATRAQDSGRVQVDCRSQFFGGANGVDAVAFAAYQSLDGFRGTVDGVAIDRMLMASDVSFYEELPKVFRRSIDFNVYAG